MQVDSEVVAANCVRAGLWVAILGTIIFWGEWWFILGFWIGVYPLAIVFAFFAGMFLEITDDEEEIENVVLENETSIVERSAEIVGRIADTNIHEWIMLELKDGKRVKLLYDRVINPQYWEPPLDRWFAIEPDGVLYLEPENTQPEPDISA